jgi:hypothetical protein
MVRRRTSRPGDRDGEEHDLRRRPPADPEQRAHTGQPDQPAPGRPLGVPELGRQQHGAETEDHHGAVEAHRTSAQPHCRGGGDGVQSDHREGERSVEMPPGDREQQCADRADLEQWHDDDAGVVAQQADGRGERHDLDGAAVRLTPVERGDVAGECVPGHQRQDHLVGVEDPQRPECDPQAQRQPDQHGHDRGDGDGATEATVAVASMILVGRPLGVGRREDHGRSATSSI